MARRDPAQLAIVDYLQLMDGGPEAESRQREVSALVGDLKGIAREFRIPVVMCCQLNRGPGAPAGQAPAPVRRPRVRLRRERLATWRS